MPPTIEKITLDRQEARLPQDLERYRQLALRRVAQEIYHGKPYYYG